MNFLLIDLKHALRSLRMNAGMTAVATLALALGIGLTATMFSIIYGVVLRGLPVEGAERVVYVDQNNVKTGEEFIGFSLEEYKQYSAQQQTFEAFGAYRARNAVLSGVDGAESFQAVETTGGTLAIGGAQPLVGRLLDATDELAASPAVALISESIWASRFGRDVAIVGQPIRIDGRQVTVVGVLPSDFAFPADGRIWMPVRGEPGNTFAVAGKLRPGTSRSRALADLTTIAERLESQSSSPERRVRPFIEPYTVANTGRQAVAVLYTMFAAVLCVLLVGCTNVANLQLGKAIVRSREVGIRAALGASRLRIARLVLAESLLLSIAGAILATVFATYAVRIFNASLEPSYTPFFIDIRVDMPSLLFVGVAAMLTAAVAGALPAIRASGIDVSKVLNDESRGASSMRVGRLSKSLVVFQIGLSCALLVGAGLTIKSIVKLRGVDLGFDDARVFSAYLARPQAASDSALPRFIEDVSEQLGRIPEFEVVALASGIPGLGGGGERVALEGVSYARPQDYPNVLHLAVTPTYTAVLGVRLLEGRTFNAADRAGASPVALVNSRFAHTHFPGQSAVGRRIRLAQRDSASDDRWMTIVGVMPDLRYEELAAPDPERTAVFTPLAQTPLSSVYMLGRMRSEALAVTTPVRRAVAAVDPDVPVLVPRTVRQAVETDTWFFDVFGSLLIIFGLVALGLAAVGLYAVVAFSVSQRTREVGIRLAVGAEPSKVVRMILREGGVQMVTGIAFGLVLAMFVSRLLSTLLFDVNPRDPMIFLGVAGVLGVTALVACIVPALRAARIHPMEVLH